MRLSTRIQQVKPSATLTINAKANQLKAQGRDVLSLAAGEPDFPPPDHVLQAAKEAIDGGFSRYTPVPGIPELRQAVADYFQRQFSFAAAPEMTIVTNGGKQGLYNLCQVLLDPGDEVLIPAPYWVSYPDMVSLAGGSSVVVPTQPEKSFLLSLDDLEAALTSRSRALILNTPSNPTGCHYSQEDLDQVMEWALNRGLVVISDEIYDQFVYPPAQPSTAVHWLEKAPEQVAVVNGLSKCFALTGWRIGYVLADKDLIASLSKIQGQSTSNICSIAQKAALAALSGSWDFLEEQRRIFAARRDKALDIMSTWPDVHCPKPEGAFYLFPRVDSHFTPDIPDSTELCAHLLDQAEVAMVPGKAFGDDRCIRLSYATDEDTLMAALERIGRALQAMR
jgi:aspartate aminotransferase